jgi:hypothetical protein
MEKKSSLEMFASELVAKNHFIKASFGGFAGSGKSRTGCEFVAGAYKLLQCTKPILIIDNEKGSRFMIPFFKKELPQAKVFIKDTASLADLLTAMQMLNSGEIDFLFIDSLSKVWYQFVRDYKQKNRLSFMGLQDWGKILPDWQEKFSDLFVGSNGNIVFTGRGGFQYEKEEDEKNEDGSVKKKGAFVKSGVKMKVAGETPFEPDLNIWMEQQQEMVGGKVKVYREAQIMKDRSALIDGKTFVNPKFKDFAPVIKFLIGLPVGEVKGATDESNLSAGENWDARNRRDQREIYLEEIKAVFDALSLGTSTDAKKLKVHVLETIYGTPSWTAIEKLQLEKLELGNQTLKAFKLKYVNAVPDSFEDAIALLDTVLKDVFEFDKP